MICGKYQILKSLWYSLWCYELKIQTYARETYFLIYMGLRWNIYEFEMEQVASSPFICSFSIYINIMQLNHKGGIICNRIMFIICFKFQWLKLMQFWQAIKILYCVMTKLPSFFFSGERQKPRQKHSCNAILGYPSWCHYSHQKKWYRLWCWLQLLCQKFREKLLWTCNYNQSFELLLHLNVQIYGTQW